MFVLKVCVLLLRGRPARDHSANALKLGGDAAEEPDFFDTQITRIQRNKIGRHFFTTSDGQVWRQIQIGPIRAPAALPADATIRQMMSGAIRLEIEDNGRSYSVNRIE